MGSQIPGNFPIGKRLAIDSDRCDNLRVALGALCHCGLFGRGALYAMIATENGGGGGSGIRTGRTFRAFQFGALVVIEDTHEITKYLMRFSGSLNVQHAA
jgi:hypothetical protein